MTTSKKGVKESPMDITVVRIRESYTSFKAVTDSRRSGSTDAAWSEYPEPVRNREAQQKARTLEAYEAG
jgi:hypothetical protein